MIQMRADRVLVASLMGSAAAMALHSGAQAQTTEVDASQTTPLVTSVDGDIAIGADGEIDLSGDEDNPAGGVAITIDSDSTVFVGGSFDSGTGTFIEEAGAVVMPGSIDGATGVLVTNNVDFTYSQSGQINLIITDPDDDDVEDPNDPNGVIDLPRDLTSDRFGFRVAAGAYSGSINFEASSLTFVDGDNSAGIAIDGAFTGDFVVDGDVVANGIDSTAIRITDTFTGDVTFGAASNISAIGQRSNGVLLSGMIDGAFELEGSVIASGFVDSTPDSYPIEIFGLFGPNPSDEQLDLFLTFLGDQDDQSTDALVATLDGLADEDLPEGFDRDYLRAILSARGDGGEDLITVINAIREDRTLQGGFESGDAIRVENDITGGFLIDGLLPSRFARTPDDFSTDLEADEITLAGVGTVTVQGSGHAIAIDGGTDGLVLGLVDTSNVVPAGTVLDEGADPDSTADDQLILPDGEIDFQYGEFSFINRGILASSGLFPGIDSETIFVRNATLEGGFRNDGTVTANAIEASASAAIFDTGADIPILVNEEILQAQASGFTAVASTVVINAGASVDEIVNNGSIGAFTTSDIGDAFAIRDLSGSVQMITNAGLIQASVIDDTDNVLETTDDNEVPIGTGIAIDVSANTTGVEIYNTVTEDADLDALSRATSFGLVFGDVITGSGNDIYRADAGFTNGNVSLGDGDDLVDLSQTASINGDIDFGTGNDALMLDNALIVGNVDFGTGNNTLILDSGSVLTGALSVEGTLDVAIDDSSLFLGANGGTTLNTLTVGDGSILGFQVSDDGQAIANLSTTGLVTIGDGAEIQTRFNGAFIQDISATVISAAMLDVNLDEVGVNTSNTRSFLFDQTLSLENGGNDLVVTLARRDAEALGIGAGFAAAYEPVVAALVQDEALGANLFNATTQEEFFDQFNQVLAAPLDAPLAYARAQNNSITSIITQRVDNLQRDEALPRTAWLQEETYFVDRESDESSNGFDGGGFVVAFGADAPVGPVDVVGVSVHLASARYDEQLGEDFPFNRLTYGADLYAADAFGPVEVDARIGYAIANSDSERNIVSGSEQRLLTGDWEGTQLSANGRVRYRQTFGKTEVVPFVSLDYLSLTEDSFSETGDDVLALTAAEREAESLRANVGASVGRVFDLRPSAFDTSIPGTITPRVTAAWSQELFTDPIEATYNFDGGDPFTLTSEPESSSAIIGTDIEYENQYAKIHVGASGTFGENTNVYMLRLGVGLKW